MKKYSILVYKSPIYEQSRRVIGKRKKGCTGEISQDSKSAIFIQISCFAAEIIFYWY